MPQVPAKAAMVYPSALLGFERIRLAAYTSLLSKATTLILQLIAVPMAIKWLGTDGYALYVVSLNAFGWIGVANLGLPQAVAISLPGALADKSIERAAEIFQSAFVTALLMLSSTALLVELSPVFHADNHLRVSAWLLASLIVFNMGHGLLCVVESAQAAFQELHLFNLLQAIASLAALLAVFLFAFNLRPSVVLFVVAMNIVPLLARFVNAVVFFKKHPDLVPFRWVVTLSRSRGLLQVGCSYFVVSLGSYLLHQYSVAQVGLSTPAAQVTIFSAAMTVYAMGFSMISMITVPMTPAVALHTALNNHGWIRNAHKQTALLGFGYSFLSMTLFATVGPIFFRFMLHGTVEPTRYFCVLLGAYFSLCVFEHIYYQFLIGMGESWRPAIIFVGRSLLIFLLTPLVASRLGIEGVIILLCGSVQLIKLTMFGTQWHAKVGLLSEVKTPCV